MQLSNLLSSTLEQHTFSVPFLHSIHFPSLPSTCPSPFFVPSSLPSVLPIISPLVTLPSTFSSSLSFHYPLTSFSLPPAVHHPWSLLPSPSLPPILPIISPLASLPSALSPPFSLNRPHTLSHFLSFLFCVSYYFLAPHTNNFH